MTNLLEIVISYMQLGCCFFLINITNAKLSTGYRCNLCILCSVITHGIKVINLLIKFADYVFKIQFTLISFAFDIVDWQLGFFTEFAVYLASWVVRVCRFKLIWRA